MKTYTIDDIQYINDLRLSLASVERSRVPEDGFEIIRQGIRIGALGTTGEVAAAACRCMVGGLDNPADRAAMGAADVAATATELASSSLKCNILNMEGCCTSN